MAPPPMTALVGICLCLSLVPVTASALSGATVDSADRFPFVVEVKLQDRLICSGTVLYPRIVVTAAHCLQQKVYWRGAEFYADSYLASSDLSVGVIRADGAETFAVAETAISPDWLALNDAGGVQRFPYDLALIITKEPIAVETPPSSVGASGGEPLEETPLQPPIRQGLLVAFGGEHCSSPVQCEDAGVRRFLPVAIRDNSDCFKSRGADAPFLPRAVWCMESTVMPGDSGGALLIETEDGQLSYAGVISAQGGLPPELSAVTHWRRSLAAGLSPNFPFIAEKARALGYGP